jgi:MFS family permease
VAVVVHDARAPLPLLIVAAAISGLAGGIASGAQTPALRRIVPAEQMTAASSQMQGRAMAAELIGGPLGGFLFSLARWLPFGADAASFLFEAAGAGLIRQPLGPTGHARRAGPACSLTFAPGFASWHPCRSCASRPCGHRS